MRYLILFLSAFPVFLYASTSTKEVWIHDGKQYPDAMAACMAAGDWKTSEPNIGREYSRSWYVSESIFHCEWKYVYGPVASIGHKQFLIRKEIVEEKKCDFELIEKEIPFGVLGADGKILQTHADAPASACINSCSYSNLSYDDFFSKGTEPGSAVVANISYRGTGEKCDAKDGEDGKDGEEGKDGEDGKDGDGGEDGDGSGGNNGGDGKGDEGEGKGDQGYAKDSTLKEGIEKIGGKIDGTNELLKGIKDAIGKIPGGGGGNNNNDKDKCTGAGCEYDPKAEWSDEEAEKSGKNAADKIKAQLEDDFLKNEEEQKEKFNEYLDKIPKDIDQIFGSEGQNIPSIKKIEDVIPGSAGCSPLKFTVPLGKKTTEMILDVCALNKVKTLLEWVFYALTAIGIWKIFYAGLRLENVNASKGGY